MSAKDRRGVDLGSLAYFFSFLRNKYISLRLGVYAKLSCVPPRFIFALCSWQAPHSRDFFCCATVGDIKSTSSDLGATPILCVPRTTCFLNKIVKKDEKPSKGNHNLKQ